MDATFFEDLEQTDESYNSENNKPFWALDFKNPANEKTIHNWLKNELAYLEDAHEDRLKRVENNLVFYKGIQYRSQEIRNVETQRPGDEANGSSVEKIVINDAFRLVQDRSSRLLKYKPAVFVAPSNTGETSDYNSARVGQRLVEHIWYEQRFDSKLVLDLVKKASICGEAYWTQTWDPDAGDLDPDYVALEKKYGPQKVPLMNEEGEPVLDADGKPILLRKPVRTGDVKYEILTPTDVLFDKKPKWDDINHCFIKRYATPHELLIKFPKKERSIKFDRGGSMIYDFEKMTEVQSKREIVYYEFYHRRHPALDQGALIVFTEDGILDVQDFPYNHKNLPMIRFADIELPNQAHGESFLEIIKPVLGMRNNLANMILRNQLLVSHPHWVYPAGTVNKVDLGNDITMVEYLGNVPPQLMQTNPTPNEVFKFRTELKEEVNQIALVYGVSSGDVPPGITAGIALQFLAEQEAERYNELILKFSEMVVAGAKMTLAICGDYYRKDDGRMIRVMGKDQAWHTVLLDHVNFSKNFDVRVEQSSALSNSKTGRFNQLVFLKQTFPQLISDEHFVSALDLGDVNKVTDQITQSIRAAESENEFLLAPKGSSDDQNVDTAPKEYEDHIVHWTVHTKKVREFGFKQLPEEIQERMFEHLLATEGLMWERAQENPAYLQKLATLPDFPLLFKDDQRQAGALAGGGGTSGLPPTQVTQESPSASAPASPGQTMGKTPADISQQDTMQTPPGSVPGVI